MGISLKPNELRKDYLLDRTVVIAVQRKKRPTDFYKKREEKAEVVCPFCPGNEHMTPPATLVYLSSNNGIKKDRDQNETRHQNWLVRSVPNLYPIFSPPTGEKGERKKGCIQNALGHHEILIESPKHEEHPGVAKVSQLTNVINAIIDRLNYFSKRNYVKYVSIFRNHGREAGASLSHAHCQLIATPFIPRLQKEELHASKKAWKKNGECIFCSILRKERNSPRFIWEDDRFIAFAPWASVHPFEFWILPKNHQSTLLDIKAYQIRALAKSLRVCLGGLRTLLNDPPYNFGFHMSPTKLDYYHWHLEVYPKLTVWAGLEKCAGVFVNVVSPEDAAESLRKAFQAEKSQLENMKI
jgi:UDPglucose--hexose-1-phosphate uridylyltransferase